MLQRKWTVYLIHHSHLDVGYTHTPADIISRYASFFDDLLSDIDRKRAGEPELRDYVYTVECFWVLEQYLKQAAPDKVRQLCQAIADGHIEVTASYFNYADILHPGVHRKLIRRACDFAKRCGAEATSAMFSDVNGLNITAAMALADEGVANLFTSVHSGHGLFALGQKHIPFRWQLPGQRELLVYNGELYTFGNEFGFSPRGSFSDVMDDDGYQAKQWNYGSDEQHQAAGDAWLALPRKRFAEFLGHLESVGHPFDFVAMGLHGTDDDNAIPNPGIMSRIRQWNERYGDEVQVRLITLTEFFDTIRNHPAIASFSGDWPDWWSDGVGSAPRHVAFFRRAQTEYLYLKDMAPDLTRDLDEAIETTLALFAEHTYGHFLSVADPYLPDCSVIELIKQGHIGQLLQWVGQIRNAYYQHIGAAPHQIQSSNRFILINPACIRSCQVVPLRFDKYDLYTYSPPYRITDQHGRNYRYYLQHVPELRASMPHVAVDLAPLERLELTVTPCQDTGDEIDLVEQAYYSHAAVGYDRIFDIHQQSVPAAILSFDRTRVSEDRAVCGDYCLAWDTRGLYSFSDSRTGQQLFNGREGLGQPILEIMRQPRFRQSLGREAGRRYAGIARVRKTLTCDRFFGQLDYADLIQDNPWFFELAFDFKLDHVPHCRQIIRVNKETGQIDMSVDIDLQLLDKPYQFYLALPLAADGCQVYLDRGDHLAEAWQDQLPGTLTDHNTVFGGLVVKRNDMTILVASPDVPLVQLRSYRYQPAVLMCSEIRDLTRFDLYSWPVCTVWNTNFFARSSQRLRLHYNIRWGADVSDDSVQAFFRLSSLGLIQFKAGLPRPEQPAAMANIPGEATL